MNKFDKKLLIPIAVVIILLLGLFVYVSLSRTKTKKIETVKPILINEYANSPATVSYMVDGQINGNESHRAIKITISKDSRLIEVLSGYQYTPINTEAYNNTVEAYEPFLASLQVAGFAKKRANSIASSAGARPLGNRYYFESIDIPSMPDRLWSSTCSTSGLFASGGRQGTFAGNLNTIQQLFQKQIPDYATITKNVKL